MTVLKKKTWIVIVILLLLVALGVSFWLGKAYKRSKLEGMCKSSVNAALEHFEEYETNGKEADYLAGVAEFRAYMTAYLNLRDGVSDTDYIWCNILYGDMTLNPEKVKAHISELVDALEYLVQDYDHPNGFNLINELNNQLKEA